MTWQVWLRRLREVLYGTRPHVRRSVGGRGASRQIECLEERRLLTINFEFHFDDSSGFFTQEKRQTLEFAGNLLAGQLNDVLLPITPGAGNTWTALFSDPATGSPAYRDNLSIGISTLVVFVGARDLPFGTYAEGAPGGYTGNGSSGWLDTLAARGQAGALTSSGQSATDFGPWGGSLAFDSLGTDWYSGISDFGLGSSQIDFQSVALHELGHLLGFGTSESFDRYVVSGKFLGPRAQAAYDFAGAPPLSNDRAHWADGLTDGNHETAMDPTISPGTRKPLTSLDIAALYDIGWNSNSAAATGTVNITPTTGLFTTEAGGTASFQVVLGSRPNSDVTFNLGSLNIDEGILSTSTLIFTPSSWDVPQNVVVTGIDDLSPDGDVVYTISTSQVVSNDPRFHGVNPADLTVTNLDNERSGITVTPTTGLVTTEQGGSAAFSVFLNSAPTSAVSIRVSSSNTREGTVSISSLLFTPANWNIAQSVVVRGVDDRVSDSNKVYTIILAAAVSSDPSYSGLNPSDVTVVNTSIPDLSVTINLSGSIPVLQPNGMPVVVDSAATVQDPDTPFLPLNGAKLIVNISQNANSGDRLSIRNEGKGRGMLGVSSDGKSVSFEGKKIGSVTTTSSGTTVTFNSAATILGVQSVVRHFEMKVSSSNRSNLDRSVSFRLLLTDGTSSNVATKAVRVNTGILPPVLNVGPSALEYANRSGPQLISPTASLIDPDSINFGGGKLTVQYLSGADLGDVLQIRRQGRGAGQIDAANDGTIRFGTTVIGSWSGGKTGKPLVITLKSTASLSAVQALIRNIMFSTSAANSSLKDRVLQFQVSDGDGGVSAAVTKTVKVK